MKRPRWLILTACALLTVSAALLAAPALAQDPVYPLPSTLYLLTSDQRLIAIDPVTGGQTVISSEQQPIADFDISPDGAWYVYRTWSNNAVVVSALTGLSGYVLEFPETPPPATTGAATLAWAPDASAIAYIVTGGVRIAELGAGEYGEALFTTLQGPWTEIFWTNAGDLVALDATGRGTRINGTQDAWLLEPVADASALRPPDPIPSILTPAGVQLASGAVIPATAGALAFEWAPLPPPLATGAALTISLFYIAPDAAGVDQVWQMPTGGEPARALTAESNPITNYAVSPDGSRLAYVTLTELVVANLDGTGRRPLAVPILERRVVTLDWSPDGTTLAYHDDSGIWIVPADGSQPPRLAFESLWGDGPPNIRVYRDPQWSPDGTRLLILVGFWEGATLAVADPATGTVTDFARSPTPRGGWTDDGRVLAWSASFGYQSPGLYLLDPALPDGEASVLLGHDSPVFDVVQGPDGAWYALLGVTAEMGPQFLRVMRAETLAGPFVPMYDDSTGGFATEPELAIAGTGDAITPWIAGFEHMEWSSTEQPTGNPIVIHVPSGTTVRLQTTGSAHQLRWAP